MFEVIRIHDVRLEIAQWIKSERKRRKITQQHLADELALSRITIQNLESGQNSTIDTLLKVVQHFDLLKELLDTIQNDRKSREAIKDLY